MRRSIHGALALTLALGLVACGDDDEDATTDDPAAETSNEDDDAAAGADDEALDADVVTVTAVDYAYEGLPETVPAGTRLELVSDSEGEIHELVAFRIPDDEERSIDALAALPPEELLPLVGPEPAAVLLVPPGGDQIPAVGDGTLTEPGRYGIICVIPQGADPGEYLTAAAESEGGPPQVDGGPPHIVLGMYGEVVVE